MDEVSPLPDHPGAFPATDEDPRAAQLDAAEAVLRRALLLNPDQPGVLFLLGAIARSGGRSAEAAALFARAATLRPFAWPAAAGRQTYGAGRPDAAPDEAAPPGPEWDGSSLDGRTLLVRAERRPGDAILLARYLPLLAQGGANVLLDCAPALAPLLRRLPVTIPAAHAPPHFDAWVDQRRLPRLFGATAGTVPGAVRYLEADPARAVAWERGLPPGLRVGLAWADGAAEADDASRSIPVAAMASVVATAPHALVSLQTGPRARDVTKVFGIADRSGRLTHFGEMAAAICGLDLVITVDSAVAHLAGALGIPVWVMLPHAPGGHWPAGLDGSLQDASPRDGSPQDASPWYASMRLFRQDRPGDWGGRGRSRCRRAGGDFAIRLQHRHAAVDVQRGPR